MSSKQKPGCSCNGTPGVTVYSCSGASNVGQLANEVAVRMVELEKGSMGCLVGIGAGIPTMLLNAKAASGILMIDGCGVCCGKKILQGAGIEKFHSVVLTEMDVKKNYDLRGDREQVDRLVETIDFDAIPRNANG